MTEYTCECTAIGCTHTCTCKTDGLPPEVCCISGLNTTGWQRTENHNKTSPQKVPDWCKTGAFVYVTPDNREPFYGEVYGITYSRVYNTTEVKVTLDGETVVGVFTWDNVRRARLRQWNDDEMKSKVGKVFEDGDKNLTLCLRYQRANGTLHFEGKVMSSDSLIESDWKLDGFPCGTFERQNEDGKWVE